MHIGDNIEVISQSFRRRVRYLPAFVAKSMA